MVRALTGVESLVSEYPRRSHTLNTHLRNSLLRLSLALGVATSASMATSAETPSGSPRGNSDSSRPITVRKFTPYLGNQWIGNAIGYGPYRQGQSPGGKLPTRQQLSEDLDLISPHWNLLRLYGSREVTEDVLALIREQRLPIRVMLGAWITRETASETLTAEASRAAVASNRAEVAAAIRLANAYPEEVIAVSVGNETQVYWSDHRTQPEVLIRYIREVRTKTSVPVTTADDFNFWNKPESQDVAAEVDFIVTHIHALWAGLQLPQAMQWTERIYQEVCQHHPTKTVVIGEAGWATRVHTEGEQARLIKGRAGEQEQRSYYQEFTTWARTRKICSFFFEAFDESWKGGPHPNEVEKHWGLFRENRQPKLALQDIAANQ